MSKYQIFTVDAFTDKPFGGNPAAVVPVPADKPLTDTQMCQIAVEMNLSETAFIVPTNASGPNAFQEASQFGLRWFTLTGEVKLCGHATLATSHALFSLMHNQSDELRFDTLSGELVVQRNSDGLLTMTLPIDRPQPVAVSDDIKLLAASVFGEYRDTFEIELSPRLKYLVVHDPNATEGDIAGLVPNISPQVYAAGERLGLLLVIATAKGTSKDFHSRVFAPWAGVLEDPVCGSAHIVLAPFWEKRLDKKAFSVTQVSKRHGNLELNIVGDSQVQISGTAVTVLEGIITV
ncbi:phenazine biosynthesis PhzC/PhzF protein [Linderina pennispora]|uniref:Phenazine biosynthesis PhzC/PhzF protein n=1 Tax=Linderina pennispora TaxID=61395 RepID=A0A1Y1VXC7_9FUNG|nr:phenazine biosynthesis PhzC/PhzF protein [Linderina pennispora]ORX65930.1 phenazine biosynthesis PhzC/PhzF protein [Linderina pennispora]